MTILKISKYVHFTSVFYNLAKAFNFKVDLFDLVCFSGTYISYNTVVILSCNYLYVRLKMAYIINRSEPIICQHNIY